MAEPTPPSAEELAAVPAGRKRMVIVGGGTAGWLAAWICQARIRQNQRPWDLVMIESSAIPTIGVGEGTTALFKLFLEHFKLAEDEFVRETRATFKLGIRHRDWDGSGQYYDGPIDDPHWQRDVPGLPALELLNFHAVANGMKVSQSHHFAQLMRGGKAPFVRRGETLERCSEFSHAYHFDNAKVAAWLRARLPDLAVVDAQVETAETDEDGSTITQLRCADGRTIAGDFFIDCTGFRRKLIAAVGGDKWVSYQDCLPVNRAFPFQLQHRPGQPVAPYTHAWALGAGWLWQIPTQDRIGNGYAYCDEHATPEQAQAEVEAKLGQKIEPLADIKFQVGRLQQAWAGNCLAAGLASGFLEPLEATSIHTTLVQLLLFDRDCMAGEAPGAPEAREQYNQTVARVMDDFRTFLVMHYRGGRSDTPFWRHVKEKCLAPAAAERLASWRERLPRPEDFDNFLGLPHAETELYYPVLDGLGLLDKEAAAKELRKDQRLATAVEGCWRHKVKQAKAVAGAALGHAAVLEALANGLPIVLPQRRSN